MTITSPDQPTTSSELPPIKKIHIFTFIAMWVVIAAPIFFADPASHNSVSTSSAGGEYVVDPDKVQKYFDLICKMFPGLVANREFCESGWGDEILVAITNRQGDVMLNPQIYFPFYNLSADTIVRLGADADEVMSTFRQSDSDTHFIALRSQSDIQNMAQSLIKNLNKILGITHEQQQVLVLATSCIYLEMSFEEYIVTQPEKAHLSLVEYRNLQQELMGSLFTTISRNSQEG